MGVRSDRDVNIWSTALIEGGGGLRMDKEKYIASEYVYRANSET